MSLFFWISYSILWLLILPLVALNMVLFRQFNLLMGGRAKYADQSGLPILNKLPLATGELLDGVTWSTDKLKGKPHLLFFGSTSCTECAKIISHIKELTIAYRVTPIIFISSENSDNIYKYIEEHKLFGIKIVHMNSEMAENLDISYVPFTYAVDANGTIMDKGLINTNIQLERVLSSIAQKVA